MSSAVDLETRWAWLFAGRKTAEPIELSCVDSIRGERTLMISWDQPPGRDPLLMFEFKQSLQSYRMSFGRKGTGYDFSRGDPLPDNIPVGVVFGWSRKPDQDASDFSELYVEGRAEELISNLRIVEPRLRKVAMLLLSGVPLLCGEIDIGQPLPLQQMGDGMGRVLSLVLTIAKSLGGIVLIDEIEHGLHYSVMTEVWKAVARAARKADVQIFATTHSWECVQAAHEALAGSDPYDFRLQRLERVGDDIRAIAYDQESLATSVDMNLEVR